MLTIYGPLESKWYKKLKWKISFIQKVEVFTMASKMAAFLKLN